MNKYTFFYRTDLDDYSCATYFAKKLASALRIFWRDSLKFTTPVTCLLPSYEVVNSSGKLSCRVLPEKYLQELV